MAMGSQKENGQKGEHFGSEALPTREVNKIWYALLFAALLGPFVLREISQELEIYPAVLMPVGASMVELNDSTITFGEYELVVITADSTAYAVRPAELMGSIPRNYIFPLARSSFGLARPRYQTRWTNWFGKERNWTPAERRQTINWLRSRMKQLGHTDAVAFLVRRSVRKVNTNDGSLVEDEVQSSFDISLRDEQN